MAISQHPIRIWRSGNALKVPAQMLAVKRGREGMDEGGWGEPSCSPHRPLLAGESPASKRTRMQTETAGPSASPFTPSCPAGKSGRAARGVAASRRGRLPRAVCARRAPSRHCGTPSLSRGPDAGGCPCHSERRCSTLPRASVAPPRLTRHCTPGSQGISTRPRARWTSRLPCVSEQTPTRAKCCSQSTRCVAV